MTKETVRFPDDLVDRIKGAVEESDLFESRSEFHRVSSELLLDILDADHEPTNFSYRELRAEIEEEVGFSLDGADAQAGPEQRAPDTEFLEAYVTVRRRALHGDLEGAREFVADRYPPVSVERLLLDEVIGLHRSEQPDDDSDTDRSPVGVDREVGITDGGDAGTHDPDADRSEADRGSNSGNEGDGTDARPDVHRRPGR